MRTLIFDWRVPIAVGDEGGAITGRLVWAPMTATKGSTPLGVIVAGAVVVLLLIAGVLVLRRRAAGGMAR